MLQRSSPARREDLQRWCAEARHFVEWQLSSFPDLALPPPVVSYLHDADLRINDSAYRSMQDEALDQVIASLERGVLPSPSGGGGFTIHPRWLGAIALMLVAVFYFVLR